MKQAAVPSGAQANQGLIPKDEYARMLSCLLLCTLVCLTYTHLLNLKRSYLWQKN